MIWDTKTLRLWKVRLYFETLSIALWELRKVHCPHIWCFLIPLAIARFFANDSSLPNQQTSDEKKLFGNDELRWWRGLFFSFFWKEPQFFYRSRSYPAAAFSFLESHHGEIYWLEWSSGTTFDKTQDYLFCELWTFVFLCTSLSLSTL